MPSSAPSIPPARAGEAAPTRPAPPIADRSVRAAVDALWVAAAAELGIPVRRGGEAYVHWDGRALHLAGNEALDADDTVAQLVLHEICHAITQGEARLGEADWGLDNTTDDDQVREQACLRLQAHLLGAHGLRGVLFPTTVVKPFYLALPADALGGGPDPASVPLAREAALRAARAPWAPVLRRALDETARLIGRPRHRNGQVLAEDERLRCGDCGFRTAGGSCRKAGRRLRVDAGERACARHEALPDCRECAACCRSAYDAVLLTPRAPVARRHPDLVERLDGTLRLRRSGDHCAALEGPAGGPWRCGIYADRPLPCRDFPRSSANCLDARRRVGLSL